jgi:septal ring factor EnvC (AmiA/AmiB activator)
MSGVKVSTDLVLALTVFLVVLTMHLAWGFTYYDNIRQNLNSERLEKDSILSTKLILNKSILKLKSDLDKKQSELNEVSSDLDNYQNKLELANFKLKNVANELNHFKQKSLKLADDLLLLNKKHKTLILKHNKLQVKLGINDVKEDTLFTAQ